MKKNLPIRKRRKRGPIPEMNVDITALLAIFVLMTFFLLMKFYSSQLLFNISKEIAIPQSSSTTKPQPGVVVQISPGTIWVDEKIIINDIREGTIGQELSIFLDQKEERIIPLYNELIQKRNNYTSINQRINGVASFSATVNLIVDGSIKYNFLKKILSTCAEAGYKKYQFIVSGANNP